MIWRVCWTNKVLYIIILSSVHLFVHPSLLHTLSRFSLTIEPIYQPAGQYGRAKELYKRILSVKMPTQQQPSSSSSSSSSKTSTKNKKVRHETDDNDDTLCTKTMYNLATLLNKQYLSDENEEEVVQEAQELFERVLRSQSSTLGPDHPSTLTTLQDLAVLFQHRHHYEKAQEMWERLLRGQETSLGKLDIATMTTLHRMATLLNEQVYTHLHI